MSSFARASPASRTPGIAPWLLIIGGLLALYLPTVLDLSRGLWTTDQNSHGPIVLLLGLWFIWFRYRALEPSQIQRSTAATFVGWALMVFATLIYAVGRSQEFYVFELGSLILLLVGGALVVLGATATRRMWFAFFFLLFVVPLPGSIIDAATQPMKMAVSWGAEHVLQMMDLPVARVGVVLHVGQYQLMVADACAGLNSLFTLEALGLLYMNITRHESPFRNFLLAALIVPISFTANVIRVVTLALITFYMGDEAGQGFLHGFSGMVLFLSALMLIVGVDSALRYIARKFDERSTSSLSSARKAHGA